MLLTELLRPDRVVIPLLAEDKDGVIAELARRLADCADGEYPEILRAVREREGVLSTGVGFGVAIPHARCPSVRDLVLVGGVSRSPVPFDSIDGEPVRLFFMIVGPEASAGLHVKALSRIARLVRREGVRQGLVDAGSPDAFFNVLVEAEAE